MAKIVQSFLNQMTHLNTLRPLTCRRPLPRGPLLPQRHSPPAWLPPRLLRRHFGPGRLHRLPRGLLLPAQLYRLRGNDCPAGHYCPTSTEYATQYPCAAGSYNNATGGWACWPLCISIFLFTV